MYNEKHRDFILLSYNFIPYNFYSVFLFHEALNSQVIIKQNFQPKLCSRILTFHFSTVNLPPSKINSALLKKLNNFLFVTGPRKCRGLSDIKLDASSR